MPKYFTILYVLAALLLSMTGCFGTGNNVAAGKAMARLCDRLDECNALAVGVSVDECTAMFQLGAESLTPPERSDLELEVKNCLEFASCGGMLVCLGFESDDEYYEDDYEYY